METVATGHLAGADHAAVSPLTRLLDASGFGYELVLPSGGRVRGGSGLPAFRIKVDSEKALRRVDEFGLAAAYVEGDIDFEGSLLSALELRRFTWDRRALWPALRFLGQLFFSPSTWINRRAIADHYSLGDDFYLSFTDRDYHFYSHCVFHDDAETLEQAAEHKLEQMFAALQLKPIGCWTSAEAGVRSSSTALPAAST